MNLPRILQSSKFQASFFATLLIGIPFLFTETDPNLSRLQKRDAAIEFVKTLGIIWGISIGGQAFEDGLQKYNPVGGNTSPASPQVNVGSNVTNEPPKAPDAQQTPAQPTGIAPPRTVTLKDGSTALLTLLTPPTTGTKTPDHPLLAAHADVQLPSADQKKV